jgi:hypothetical protein
MGNDADCEGDAVMLLGIVWAIGAPVLILLVGAALNLASSRLFPAVSAPVRRAASFGLPLLIVTVLWWQDRAEFNAQCASLGRSVVYETRSVEGIFLDDSTANSFGMRYLQEEGFQWMEARSIYARNRFTRYERHGSEIRSREIDAISASVAVIATHDRLSPWTSAQRVTIKDRSTGQVLATAAQAHFNGGRAYWLLGAWGSGSCPDPASSEGSAEFNRFYHLARLTLRPEVAPTK